MPWNKLILTICAVLLLSGCQTQELTPTSACFHDKCFDLEIAATGQQKITGLMKHFELDTDSGMLFVYEKPQVIDIWMKDMNFPIDIIWLDKKKKVVGTKENVQPCVPGQDCSSYGAGKSSKYVLEINAGLIEEYGLSLDDIIEFKY